MKISKLILVLLLPLKAMACGLDWGPLVSHFENVDSHGHVHIVRKLGEVSNLPIYLLFNSSYGTSRYTGAGFEIPFLESRMWQISENQFSVKTPSGRELVLQRTSDPTVLAGGDWKAFVKDDTISVWASCGDKMTFKNGRITELRINEDRYSYSYRGDRVDTIQKNGQIVLAVNVDEATKLVTGFDLPETHQGVAWKQKETFPKFSNLGGRIVVDRIDRSLTEVVNVDGSTERFDIEIDSSLAPTLKTRNNIVTWNPIVKTIIRDNFWSYNVESEKDTFNNANISRLHDDGTQESWHLDSDKGVEITLSKSGEKTVRSWFTSGLLNGKNRQITTTKNGITKHLQKCIYDEFGRLARDMREDRTIVYEYIGQTVKSVATCAISHRTLWEKEEDNATGRIVYQYSNDIRVEFIPGNSNKIRVKMLRNGKEIEGVFLKNLDILSML